MPEIVGFGEEGIQMQKKKLYTFIVAGNAGGKVWRLSFPHSFLAAVGIFAIIGLFAVGGAVVQYTKLILKVVDYNHRLSENDALRSENFQYKVQTAQLGEKVENLEGLAHKLMVFSGMNSGKTVGGVGGMSTGVLSRTRPVSAGTLQSMAGYDKKASSLETQYRDLNSWITDDVLAEAAMPSLQPVRGYITAAFGGRPDPFNPGTREYHTGVDISAPSGSRIIAPADGTVIFAGPFAGYGNLLVIDHKFGLVTRYAHLQRMNVQVGQHVSRNEIIGYVGMSGRTTGPHLHYEVWQNSTPLNPIRFFAAPSSAAHAP
jgi:murein DD-endopeptidase MepM/ murein hydrolase activator NlpD